MIERPILFSAPMVLALLADRKTQTRRVMKGAPGYEKSGRWAFTAASTDRSAVGKFTYSVLSKNGNKHTERGREFEVASLACPKGLPGDQLWVRETWGYRGRAHRNYGDLAKRHEVYLHYRADDLRRSLFMPEEELTCVPKQHLPKLRKGEDELDHRMRLAEYYQKYWAQWRPSIFMPRWASRLLLHVIGVRVERLQDISEEDALAEGILVDTESDERSELYRFAAGGEPFYRAKDAYLAGWDWLNGKGAAAKNPFVWVIDFKRLIDFKRPEGQ